MCLSMNENCLMVENSMTQYSYITRPMLVTAFSDNVNIYTLIACFF